MSSALLAPEPRRYSSAMGWNERPPNKGMKQTKPAQAMELRSSYGRTPCQAPSRVVSHRPPWGPQTTDEAGRFDDESFSYARVARSAEPHDRSPSRGNAVLSRESRKRSFPVAKLRRVSSGSCLPSSVDCDLQAG